MLRLNEPDGRASYFGRPNTTDAFTSYSKNVVGAIVRNTDSTYTLTYKDGRVHKFSSTGRLLLQKERNGSQTSLNYNGSGILTGITDAVGRILTIATGSNGNVSQISDSVSVVATYEYYPSTSLLKTVTYNDGSKYQYEYDTTTVPGKIFLKTVKDALDNILETHQYDSRGRATTSEKPGGVEKYTILYDQSDYNLGLYTQVTDARSNVTKYFFNRNYGTNLITYTIGTCSCGGSASEVTAYKYDTSNSWLNLVKKTDALGNITDYTYDGSRNLTAMKDVLGTQTYTYNSLGEVLTATDRMGGVTTNTYSPAGNLLTTKDALNNVTTIVYPAANNKGLPDSIKDARLNVTKLKWFPASGLLQEVEDPYTKKTSYTYDARGRVKTVTNALNYVTQFNYFDDTQRKVEMIYPNLDKVTYQYDIRRLLESMTDERGKVTGYHFDTAYRLDKITDPLGHFKQFSYDLMSNLQYYTDPLGNVTENRYDDFNRIKETVYPPASTGATPLSEKIAYDQLGRIKTVTDTANRDTTYTYDLLARINTVTNPENEVTQTKYNQRGQTIEVKDAINQVYQFSYDPLGRVLSQTRAGGTMSFEYDEVGNRKKRTDYIGHISQYTYDKLNRMTKIEYGNPAGQGTTKQYSYDDLSRLTSAVNEAGTVTFGYDNRNREILTTDVFGHTINYEYERTSAVNQRRLKLDGAMYAVYNFDDANRLSNIVNSGDSTTISYGYDNEDKVTSRTYPNGVVTTYDYDNMDRLKELKDVSNGSTLFDRNYSYNAANQIGQITDLTQTKIFGYNNADRLTSVTNSNNQNESYLFHKVGNRTSSFLSSSYSYQPFNRLAATQTASYNFDANGNTTAKFEGSNFWRYGFDYENQMYSASTRKQTVRYVYDALGRRVRRHIAGSKENTKFTYDSQDVLLDDDSGTQTKYLNGIGIDNKLRQTVGSNASYFLSDHLGSTNGLANSSGSLTASNSYDSFGSALNGSFPTRYQYTGREADSFTGFQFSRARSYDPKLGRFLSEDPIGFAGGDVNLYGYVRNNSVNFVDPSGLQGNGGLQFLPQGSIGKDSYDKIRKSFESMKNNCECRKAFEGFGINLDDFPGGGVVVGSSDTVANPSFRNGDLRLSDSEREHAIPHVNAARAFTVTTTDADPRPKIFIGPDAYLDRWSPFSDPDRNLRRAFAHELMHAGNIPGRPSSWPFTDDLSYADNWWPWPRPYSNLIKQCGN